jgi:hypothetical protein
LRRHEYNSRIVVICHIRTEPICSVRKRLGTPRGVDGGIDSRIRTGLGFAGSGGGDRRRVGVGNNSGQGAAMTIAITRAIRAAKLTGTDTLRVGGSTWWSRLRAHG